MIDLVETNLKDANGIFISTLRLQKQLHTSTCKYVIGKIRII